MERTLEWKTSSYTNNENCVEVQMLESVVRVRDTKDRTRRPIEISRPAWRAFINAVDRNEFSA